MRPNTPHILQVIGSSVFGGATRVIMAISQGLVTRGYRVSVLSSDPKTQAAFASLGIPVIRCRNFGRKVSPRDVAAVTELMGICREEGVDLLHTHTSKGGAVGRVAAGLLGLPVVHTVHGFAFNEFSTPLQRFVYTGIERVCAPLTRRLVLMNDDEYRLVTDGQWLVERRCRLIRNGIPVPPAPEPVGTHDGAPMLVAVGRLAEQKGYRYLLEAMPRVLMHYPAARLFIVGDGEDRVMLHAQAVALDLHDAVTFTGFQPNPLDWLERAHVAVSSSLWEGLPIAVLEMMASRRPIVATACRGTRDVLRDGENALLAPCADPIALAERIIDMLDDPARAAMLAETARQELETRYPETRMVDDYVDLFTEIAPVTVAERRGVEVVPRVMPAPETDGIRVRPFVEEDVPQAVRIHLDAFPGFFLTALGPAFLRHLYLGFCHHDDGFGYVAIDRFNRVMGVVAGTAKPGGFFRRLLIAQWWKFGIAALPAVLKEPATLPRVVRSLLNRGEAPTDGALLSTIAVTPYTQGKGIGSHLLAAFCKEAALRGAPRVFLTTDQAENDAVKAFYHRQGFLLDGEFRTPEGRVMNRYVLEVEA